MLPNNSKQPPLVKGWFASIVIAVVSAASFKPAAAPAAARANTSKATTPP